MIRKALPCALTALSLASLSTFAYGQATKPNIVVILADDLDREPPHAGLSSRGNVRAPAH